MKRVRLKLPLLLALALSSGQASEIGSTADNASASLPDFSAGVTNIGQLSSLLRSDFNRGRALSFTGIVTLVDRDRSRLVLQDATGALMWYSAEPLDPALVGKQIRLDCPDGYPYRAAFPDFPARPSGAAIENSFEAPVNWGDYHLNRLAGYLRPPQSGEYTFWIASDDSSELWLSVDENPTRVRKIALVAEGSWTNPHDWERFPSQRSERIYLRADQSYYIEAFGEQAQQDDHLSVAWEGPGIARSVIPGTHLTPWAGKAQTAVSNGVRRDPTSGILREYWTNYAVGSVVPVTSSGPVGTTIAGTGAVFQVIGPGTWPEPQLINLHEPLPPENDFRWIQAEGILNFVGTGGTDATLELAAGAKRVLVRVANWDNRQLQTGPNWQVQIRGVCEVVTDANGDQSVGFIWVPSSEHIQIVESPSDPKLSVVLPDFPSTNSTGSFGGYYAARGAVMFDGRFAGQRYLYVQDIHGSVRVSDVDRVFKSLLEVGQRIQVGGTLSLGKAGLTLVPITLRRLGWESLPMPADTGTDGAYGEGQWTEVMGVVRSVGADGIFKLKGRGKVLSVWCPVIPVDDSLVDGTAHLRGVISLDAEGTPLLLVGSRQFVEIKERSPQNPFSLPLTRINDLDRLRPDVPLVHRVKVEGTVTYADQREAFLQDSSGAVRLQIPHDFSVQPGVRLEVAGFPDTSSSVPTLTDLSLRATGIGTTVKPNDLDLREAFAKTNHGRLIQVRGYLLAQKNQGAVQILELQSGHRAFEAVLTSNDRPLPRVAVGSQLDITGICVESMIPVPDAEPGNSGDQFMSSLQILLRAPTDITVLRGPPWWTPMKMVALIGFLLTVLGGTLLWVRLLGRKFERRQRAQLEFSRQILQSQEAERRRIAANLHDSLGQNLLVIKNQVRLAMQPAPDRGVLSKRLDEISGMASQVIEEVRRITHDLRPYQLERVGLTQTLRGTVRRVSENSPIVFASHVDDVDGLFDRDAEVHIYRILQEALNNVVKHSGATEATAMVKKETNAISIVVRDNGCGLGCDTANGTELSRAGFGLSGIAERARILHGMALVDSHPGRGFRVTVEIPLARQV